MPPCRQRLRSEPSQPGSVCPECYGMLALCRVQGCYLSRLMTIIVEASQTWQMRRAKTKCTFGKSKYF